MLGNWFDIYCFENISTRITVNGLMNFISEGITAHMNQIYLIRINRISSIKLEQVVSLLKFGQ